MKKLKVCFFTVLFMALAVPAFANLITVTVNQGSNTNTQTFTSVQDAFDKFEKGDLNQIMASYDKNLPGTGFIDFRGVPVNLAYTQVAGGGWNISVDMPTLGRVESFTGVSQDDAFNKFKKFLEKNQDGLLKDLLNSTVKATPFDAVAGNINSLIFRMLDSAYNTVEKDYIFRPYFSYNHIKARDGKSASAYTVHLPLGYNFKINEKSRIILDVPLSFTSISSSQVYDIQLGLAYKQEVYNQNGNSVALAAGARLGLGGSIDLLSGGLLWSVSGSVISKFQINDKFSIGMVNTLGFYDDVALKIKDYEISYNLAMLGFKNGLEFTYAFTPEWSGFAGIVDTRFFGNKQYINAYEELRLGMNYKTPNNKFIDQFTFFASYQFGEHNTQGFRLGFDLKF